MTTHREKKQILQDKIKELSDKAKNLNGDVFLKLSVDDVSLIPENFYGCIGDTVRIKTMNGVSFDFDYRNGYYKTKIIIDQLTLPQKQFIVLEGGRKEFLEQSADLMSSKLYRNLIIIVCTGAFVETLCSQRGYLEHFKKDFENYPKNEEVEIQCKKDGFILKAYLKNKYNLI